MIVFTVRRDQANKIASFTLTGHAGSGPYGHDLVCAAVSAVAFGAINAVEALAELKPSVRQKDQGGYLACALPSEASEDGLRKAELILEAMLVSMRTIEHSYGQYIQIND